MAYGPRDLICKVLFEFALLWGLGVLAPPSIRVPSMSYRTWGCQYLRTRYFFQEVTVLVLDGQRCPIIIFVTIESKCRWLENLSMSSLLLKCDSSKRSDSNTCGCTDRQFQELNASRWRYITPCDTRMGSYATVCFEDADFAHYAPLRWRWTSVAAFVIGYDGASRGLLNHEISLSQGYFSVHHQMSLPNEGQRQFAYLTDAPSA